MHLDLSSKDAPKSSDTQSCYISVVQFPRDVPNLKNETNGCIKSETYYTCIYWNVDLE